MPSGHLAAANCIQYDVFASRDVLDQNTIEQKDSGIRAFDCTDAAFQLI